MLRPTSYFLAGATAATATIFYLRRQNPDAGNKTPTVPATQLSPSTYESADDPTRIVRRVETVLRRRTARLIVVLERICDGHNYAAVFRTCEALGIQHVWLISPPDEENRYESATMRTRRVRTEHATAQSAKAAVRLARGNQQIQPGSRRDMRRQRNAAVWDADSNIDGEHATFGRRAARFLLMVGWRIGAIL